MQVMHYNDPLLFNKRFNCAVAVGLFPKGGSKRKTADFRLNPTSLEESLLQSFFVRNCQQQSCKAFIGLTIHAKMIGGGNPFYVKFWIKLTA